MENPFVNFAVIGLSNGEFVRFRPYKQNNVTQCKKKGPFNFVCNMNSGSILKCILLAS